MGGRTHHCDSPFVENWQSMAAYPHPHGWGYWHGATPTNAMTHIAIQEALDGNVVEWMEHVSDQQYQAAK